MDYKIAYKSSVARDLKLIGKAQAGRLITKIEKELPTKALSCPMLKGLYAGLRKFRIGDYRVIFSVMLGQILVLRIAHRKEVHRSKI